MNIYQKINKICNQPYSQSRTTFENHGGLHLKNIIKILTLRKRVYLLKNRRNIKKNNNHETYTNQYLFYLNSKIKN